MSKNSKQILFGLAIGAILMFFLQQCPGDAAELTAAEKQAVLEDSLRTFRDENGRLVATTLALESTIGSLADSLDRGNLLIAELRRKEEQYRKKLKSVTAIATKSDLKADLQPSLASIGIRTDTIRDTLLLIMTEDTKVKIQPDEAKLPQLIVSLTDRIVVTHAYEKGGFLKRKPLRVFVENTNEHVQIIGTKSLVIPPPQRRLCTWLKEKVFKRQKPARAKG